MPLSDFEPYHAALRQKLAYALEPIEKAHQALTGIAKYWRTEYSLRVPNAEHQLISEKHVEIAEESAQALENVQAIIKAAIPHVGD